MRADERTDGRNAFKKSTRRHWAAHVAPEDVAASGYDTVFLLRTTCLYAQFHFDCYSAFVSSVCKSGLNNGLHNRRSLTNNLPETAMRNTLLSVCLVARYRTDSVITELSSCWWGTWNSCFDANNMQQCVSSVHFSLTWRVRKQSAVCA
jgi:hypothetical protein